MSLGFFFYYYFAPGQNVIIIIICLKQSSCGCKEKSKKCIQAGLPLQTQNQNTQFDWCVCYCISPTTLNHLHPAGEFLKQFLLKVKQQFRITARWLNLYTTDNFLNNSHYMFQTLLQLNSQVVREGKDCISTPPCLFKDTCWAAWLISSSFSRLSGLRGADYQEELIPVALLISLIRAPGRWLEGSCVSHGCSGTAICTGMVAVPCYTREDKTKMQP